MTLKTETINPEVYQVLKDIVGSRHISRESALLDGYCYGYAMDIEAGGIFGPRPLAVVMPGSVDEVQAIVKACNQHKILFKAITSGFGKFGLYGEKPFLVIELRRMNRILKIEEKDMYAVFEPFVTFGALMNASIKKGVRPYIVGAGPSASPLANSTNMQGYGTTNVSAGWGGRVILGVEWVLPDGRILRLGTLGTTGEWWNGDGPGPSLRGILRGHTGAVGALGIVTKVAIKLVPWYGPTKIGSYGDPPQYKAVVPEEISNHTLTFPSREKLKEALRQIQEEGISYWCSRRGPFTMAAAATGSNREVVEMWQTGEFKKNLERFNHNISVGLDAGSPLEMEFKKKCLQKILEMFDGEELEEDVDSVTARFVHAFNGLGAVKGTFRSTGGMNTMPSVQESLDAIMLGCEKGVKVKNKYAKTGVFLDDGDSTWITLLEDYCGHMEVPIRYDPTVPESVRAASEHDKVAAQAVTDWNLSIGAFEWGGEGGSKFHDKAGPRALNYNIWIKKIRSVLDPNQVGEPGAYPMP